MIEKTTPKEAHDTHLCAQVNLSTNPLVKMIEYLELSRASY